MHKKLAAIFAEAATPKHCARASALAALNPVAALTSDLRRQLSEYRARILDAETDPSVDDVYRQKLEHLVQSIDAGDRIASDLTRAVREVAGIVSQVEREFAQAHADIEETDRRKREAVEAEAAARVANQSQ